MPRVTERSVRWYERRSVVGVYQEPQADEPPGRGNWREVEVTVAATETLLADGDVEGRVRAMMVPR